MTDEKTTPERRRPELWRTTQTPEGFRPTPRQQQRDARAYAEDWYQALRAWEVHTTSELVPRTTGGGSAGRMTVIVGNYGRGQATLDFRRVHTPMGWVAESALAVRCNADSYLSRLRGGAGLGSLIHGSGQGWNGAEARAYAAAVLRLAVALGDARAVGHLQHLVET